MKRLKIYSLRYFRKEIIHYTQKQLGISLGCSESYICYVENAKKRANCDFFENLGQKFNLKEKTVACMYVQHLGDIYNMDVEALIESLELGLINIKVARELNYGKNDN